MRSIGRAAALVAVLGMPAIAYVFARVAISMWAGMDSSSLADASVAVEDGLALLAATVGATIAAYLALTGYAMLLGCAWRGGRGIPRALASLAPHGWTRVTATALGLSLSAGLAAPALAADAGSTQAPSAGWAAAPISVAAPTSVPAHATTLTVGWVAEGTPTPQVTPPQSGSPSTSTLHDVPALDAVKETPSQAPSAYVVQPGDSLWRITEALLGADASTAHVAEAWPQLYEANRDSIGGDPSLIHPGLALTIPAGLGA